MAKRRWRLPMPSATGVVFSEDRLIGCVVGTGLTGPVERGRFELPIDDEGPGGALRKAFEEGHIQGRLGLGVGTLQTLSAIVPVLPEDDSSASKQAEGRFPGLEGGLVGLRESVSLPTGPHTQLTACRRLLAQELLDAIENPKTAKQALLMPAPHALSRVILARRRAPKAGQVEIQILPTRDAGLAVLFHGKTLLAWRPFDWPGQEGIENPRMAVLSLLAYGRSQLGLPPPKSVVLRTGGEPDEGKRFEEACGVPTEVAGLLEAGEEAMAFAVGSATLRQRPGQTELFSDIRPPRGLVENFPVVAVTALVLVISGIGYRAYDKTEANAEKVATSKEAADLAVKPDDRVTKAKPGIGSMAKTVDEAKLRTEHASGSKETELAQYFIVERTLWRPILTELPRLLPASMTVFEIRGRRGLVGFGANRGRSTGDLFTVYGQVPFDDRDATPPEMTELTDALKSSEALTGEFPVVKGANVRYEKRAKAGDLAKFIVVCVRGQG